MNGAASGWRVVLVLAAKDVRLLSRDRVALFFTLVFPLLFGILFGVYKRPLFFWQLYSTLRRTIQVVVFVMLANDRVAKYAVGTMFNVLFLVLQVQFKPFAKRQENVVESLSLSLQTLVTCMLPMFDEPYSNTQNWAILSVGFVPAVVFLSWALSKKITAFVQRVGALMRRGPAKKAPANHQLSMAALPVGADRQ